MMLVLITAIAFISCRHKSDNGGITRKIEPEDFRAMFHNLNLPANFGDSSLFKKPTDSSMSWSVYSQFIADSLIQKYFGKSIKPRLFATGKLVVKNAETYLLIKAITPSKKILYIVCLDMEGKFKTGMPLIIREDDSEIRYAATIINIQFQ
jgi:hypothetical protein